MAYKVQTNLDLNGFNLENFCIQPYTSVESLTKALGRKVFVNGNSNAEHYLREVIYDGTQWKATAYLDDIEDMASNADFLALKARVDAFLDGDVDSDGVLENLKEIQAFLDNYSDATDLSEILATKLDKTGGTMTGNLNFNYGKSITSNGVSVLEMYAGVDTYLKGSNVIYLSTPKLYHIYDGAISTILHSGNYSTEIGDYYLKTSGGVMTGILGIGNGNSIQFLTSSGSLRGQLGSYSGETSNELLWYDTNQWNYLIHSGTIDNYLAPVLAIAESALAKDSFDRIYAGAIDSDVVSATTMYADTFTGNATSATKLANARTIWGQSFDGTEDVSSIPTFPYCIGVNRANNGTIIDDNRMGFVIENYASHIELKAYNTSATRVGAIILNSSGNVTIGSSDLAGTDYKLVVNGLSRFKNNVESDGNIVGAGAVQAKTSAHGFVSLQVGSTGNKGLLDSRTSWFIYTDGTDTLLTMGNIGIGTIAPKYRLDVSGTGRFTDAVTLDSTLAVAGTSTFAGKTTHNGGLASTTGSFSSTLLVSDSTILDDTLKVARLATFNGGAYIPTGQTIQFGLNGPTMEYSDGAIKVTGNFYATGTVASGNVGEEGSGGGGGGSASIRDYTLEIGSSSYPITHSLGTTNVIVQVFEENTASGSSVWDMILTDISITDSNNIVITFGRATTARHLVHIIGGE